MKKPSLDFASIGFAPLDCARDKQGKRDKLASSPLQEYSGADILVCAARERQTRMPTCGKQACGLNSESPRQGPR